MLKEKISRFFYYPLLERESVIVVGESFIYVGSYFRLNHESLKRVQSRTKFIEIHIGIPFSLEDKLKLIRFISEHRLSILTSNVKIRKFYIPDLFSNNFPIANYPFSIQLLRNKSSVIKTFLRLFPRRGDQFLSAYFYNIHSSSYLLVFVSNHSYPTMNHLLKTKLCVLKQNYNILNLLSRNFVIFFFTTRLASSSVFHSLASNTLDARCVNDGGRVTGNYSPSRERLYRAKCRITRGQRGERRA